MSQPQLLAASQLLFQAFLVGLTGAMAPGPFLTVTVTRTLRHGRASALLMLVGHALLEALLLVGFAFGLQAFLRRPAVTTALALAGGAFLLWMGTGLLRSTTDGSLTLDAARSGDVPVSRFGPVLHGAMISLSNPYWTLWWATAGLKLASDGLALGPVGVAAFFVGHELADVAWYTLVVFTVASGKRFATDRTYRIVIGVCAAFLVYLGVQFVWTGLNGVHM
jgi:threonine/homoserine/homoserine lactone efflux protein